MTDIGLQVFYACKELIELKQVEKECLNVIDCSNLLLCRWHKAIYQSARSNQKGDDDARKIANLN
jgi:hypothetical protein